MIAQRQACTMERALPQPILNSRKDGRCWVSGVMDASEDGWGSGMAGGRHSA